MAEKCPKIGKSAYFWAERYFSLGLSTDHKDTIIESQTKKGGGHMFLLLSAATAVGALSFIPAGTRPVGSKRRKY